MKINLFGTEIELRDHFCNLFNDDPILIKNHYINLYVRFKSCNAKCLFCEYQDTANKFNLEKYKFILNYLKDNIRIQKISFTGGEPTLNLNLFKNVVLSTKEIVDVFIALNTNGINLTKIFNDNELINNINNISLSRHHYIDKINNEILGFKSISKKELFDITKDIKNDHLMHLACNLIKDKIDNKDKIFKYLEHASNININSVGLVSLMKINDYCKDNFIKISDLNVFNNDRMFLTKQQSYNDCCVCYNYRYIPKKFKDKSIKVYSKNSMKEQPLTNSLIYDGEYLRYGFSDKIIY